MGWGWTTTQQACLINKQIVEQVVRTVFSVFYPSKYISIIPDVCREIMQKMQLLGRRTAHSRVRFSRCTACSVHPPRLGGGARAITPYTFGLQPVWVGVPRHFEGLMTHITPQSRLPHSQRGQPWGRQVEDTTLNGSTMTSRTPQEEKKFWVRNERKWKALSILRTLLRCVFV